MFLTLMTVYASSASTIYLMFVVFGLIFSGLLYAYPHDETKMVQDPLGEEYTSILERAREHNKRPALSTVTVFGAAFEALMSIAFHGTDGYTYLPNQIQSGDDVLSFFSLSAKRQTLDILILVAHLVVFL